LYDLYTAAPGKGGLRVRLPPLRDGFSPQQIDLGRYLFFDPLLSGNHRLSCAHCHHPDFGFADGRARSAVVQEAGDGKDSGRTVLLARSAPTLWNVGFLQNLLWDGHVHSLEAQAKRPLFARDEMANTPQRLERDLNSQAAYRSLFAEAFDLDASAQITTDLVTRALAAFESSLISVNSRYDRYAHGDEDALTDQEKHGHAIFRGVALGCSQCHTPPLFTNDEVEVTGVPNTPGLRFDEGAGAVTNEPLLRGAFKTPTLRNIARTAPYMHSGQFKTLAEVVRFYDNRPGHAAPSTEHLQIDWRMALKRPILGASDVEDLVAFMGALTDETMTPAVPDAVPSGLPVVHRARPTAVADAGPGR
jgi:cytochrome c peroxidase